MEEPARAVGQILIAAVAQDLMDVLVKSRSTFVPPVLATHWEPLNVRTQTPIHTSNAIVEMDMLESFAKSTLTNVLATHV